MRKESRIRDEGKNRGRGSSTKLLEPSGTLCTYLKAETVIKCD